MEENYRTIICGICEAEVQTDEDFSSHVKQIHPEHFHDTWTNDLVSMVLRRKPVSA